MKPVCLLLRLEACPGATVLEVCRDAVEVAGRMGLDVLVDVNGTDVLAGPGDDPNGVHRTWLSVHGLCGHE